MTSLDYPMIADLDSDAWTEESLFHLGLPLEVEYEVRQSRRDEYRFVVPSNAREIWRSEPFGTIRDVFDMGDRRVMLDVETHGATSTTELVGQRITFPHAEVEGSSIESRAAHRYQRLLAEQFRAASLNTAVLHGAQMYDVAKSHFLLREAHRDREQHQGAKVDAVRVLQPARFPAWTLGTVAFVPLMIVALVVLSASGTIPWIVSVGVGLMALSLVTTAVLQLLAIYRSSHRTVGRQLAYIERQRR